jgi:SAM-dependent methyltransferase
MRGLARGWLGAARARRRIDQRRRPDWWDRRLDFIRENAPGNSWADIGAMWGIHGEYAFLAEESGATSVTAFDVIGPTPAFEAMREERASSVRAVEGDAHDGDLLEREVGVHDVVWCSGVIYHSPDPIRLIENLARITGSTLMLGSKVLPEVPGVEQACVFYPGLTESARAAHAAAYADAEDMIGVGTPFDTRPAKRFSNYWWGITPSALKSMIEVCGFEVVAASGPDPFFVDVVARRKPAAGP